MSFAFDVEDIGEVSDGYHTFDELYEHRTALLSAACKLAYSRGIVTYKSKKHSDGTMFDDMFIVILHTDEGPISYHCENKYWKWFRIPEMPVAEEWDGHTPEDVIKRLTEGF